MGDVSDSKCSIESSSPSCIENNSGLVDYTQDSELDKLTKLSSISSAQSPTAPSLRKCGTKLTTLISTRSSVHDLKARELLPSMLNKYIALRCSFTEHCLLTDFDEAAMDALQRMSFLQALQTVEHFTASVSPRIQKRSAYLMGILRGQETHWDNSRAADDLSGGAQQLLNLPAQMLLLIVQCCLEGNCLPSDFTPEVCLSLHSLTLPLAMKAVSAFNSNKRIIAGCRGGVVNRARFFQRLIQNVSEQNVQQTFSMSQFPNVPQNHAQSGYSPMNNEFIASPNSSVALMSSGNEYTPLQPPGLQRFCTAPTPSTPTQNLGVIREDLNGGFMKRYNTDLSNSFSSTPPQHQSYSPPLETNLNDQFHRLSVDETKHIKLQKQHSDSSAYQLNHETPHSLRKHNTSASVGFKLPRDGDENEFLTPVNGRRNASVILENSYLTDTTYVSTPSERSRTHSYSQEKLFGQSPSSEFSFFDFPDVPSPNGSMESGRERSRSNVGQLEERIRQLMVEIANAKEREEHYKFELQNTKQTLFSVQNDYNNLKRMMQDRSPSSLGGFVSNH